MPATLSLRIHQRAENGVAEGVKSEEDELRERSANPAMARLDEC